MNFTIWDVAFTCVVALGVTWGLTHVSYTLRRRRWLRECERIAE